jgi:ABC-type glycerol-3-phosphate transport system permease component
VSEEDVDQQTVVALPYKRTHPHLIRRLWLRRGRVALHAALMLWIVICLIPLIWGISSSFKGRNELYKTMPSLIPRNPILDNYEWVIGQMGSVPRYFQNSSIVSMGSVVLVLLLSSLAGYAFARLDFRGRDLIFYSLVMVMFVPRAGGLMAAYELMHFLRLRNSLLGLILAFSGGLSVPVFIMRQAFLAMPRELEDAARIDGANRWQVFWRVAVPLATGGMIVVALFTFVDVWGEFIFSLTMLDQNRLFTMAIGVAMHESGTAIQAQDVVGYGASAAVYLIAAYPVMLLFIVMQRYFMRGIMEGGIKF